MGKIKRFVVEILEDGRMFLRDFDRCKKDFCKNANEEEFNNGFDRGFEQGKEVGHTEGYEQGTLHMKIAIKNARDDAYRDGYSKGCAAYLEEIKPEMAAAENEAYTKGYFAGKRDGEMSKREIPEEVKKHLEEALSWLN